MSDETEQFILGDAAVDAASEGRRGLFGRRRKSRNTTTLTHCENCGTPLVGAFCAQCGQHAIDYRRSLWRVLIDAADSFLNWDTKFLASIWILLTKPWKLTNDFNAGRRARYVHPLRLYLLASIAFFFMLKTIQLQLGAPIELRAEDRAEIAAVLGKLTSSDSVLSADQQAKVESVRTRLTQGDGAITDQERDELKELIGTAFATKMQDKIQDKLQRKERGRIKAALARIPEAPAPPSPPGEAKSDDGVSAEATPPASEPVPPLPPIPGEHPAKLKKGPSVHFSSDDKGPKTPFESWLESRIKNKVGEDGTKAKLFLETLRSNIPMMMLFCIPLFALVLKILYFRWRRYYVEHLVYALHIHTFAYLGVLVITLVGMAVGRWSDTARGLTIVFLSCVMFVQIFLSIRKVYGQGWFFTTFKFVLGGIVYFVIIVIAVGATAFITILLPG